MTQLSVREKIGYSLGDTATNLTWRSFMVFLPIFYTDVFGLSAAAMGTLLLVCRFWDGITDFIMGVVADRTKTRWGKFRPWILWTAFPFGLLTVFAFTTPDFSYTGKLIYAYVTYSLLIIVFTANNVPYSALMGVMTSDPIERTSLSSYRFVFAYLGALIVQGGLIYLVAFFGQGNEIKGYMRTMILFAILLVVFLLITFFSTKERVKPMQSQSSIRQDFNDLVKNKPWLTLFFIGIIFVAFTSIKQGGVMFYFTHYLGAKGLAAGYMVLGLVGSLIGAAVTKRLVVRTGKRVLFIITAFISGVCSIPLFFLSPDNLVPIFIFGTISEFAAGPLPVLFFAMLADSADYSEWQNNRRATGLIFSAGSVAIKFGSGLGGALAGWVLAFYGYVKGGPNTEEALIGVRLIVSIIPALISLVLMALVWIYKLDEATLMQIEKDLSQRRKEQQEGV